MINEENVCTSVQEVNMVTEQLDKATLVPISIIDNGVVKNVDNWLGVYNNSQGRMCAAVAPNYNLVQHKEYFNNFATALGRLNIPFKMSFNQSSNKAYADIEFVGRNYKYTTLNEEFATGLRLTNSYDKTLSLSVGLKFTRLACLNGMVLTRVKNSLHLKHTSKNIKNIEMFIENYLKDSINQSEALKDLVNSSIVDSIEWLNACKIIEHLFKQKIHREAIVNNLGIACIEVEENGKKSIQYVWNDAKKEKSLLTRWDIYNAITSHITYGQHISPLIEEVMHLKAEDILSTPLIVMENKINAR